MLAWVERVFAFDFPVELFPMVVERLRGTPARLEERLRTLSPTLLTERIGEAWSVQEHSGHLLDLDQLHAGRLDDYAAGAAVLRPADMTNRKTWDAEHNRRPLDTILADFRRERQAFVARLEQLPAAARLTTALHPRLGTPMRLVDMAFFVAEHDDHHLGKITENPASSAQHGQDVDRRQGDV